jgi:predicted ATPase
MVSAKWKNGSNLDGIQHGAVSAAERKLLRSLELARQQSALSWELRAALSLTRLRIKQGRRSEGRELLEPAYHKFTEGFATLDMRSAQAILQSL